VELKFRTQHRVVGVQEHKLTGLINQKNAKHTVTKVILYAHKFSFSPRQYTRKSTENNISRSAKEKCGCNRNKCQSIITQTFKLIYFVTALWIGYVKRTQWNAYIAFGGNSLESNHLLEEKDGNTVEFIYNDTSSIASDILWYQLIPHFFFLVFAIPKCFDIYRIHKCVSL
jgi:hypothetical protein